MPRFCELCGVSLHSGARFCGSCGQPIPANDDGGADATAARISAAHASNEAHALATARGVIVGALIRHAATTAATGPATSARVTLEDARMVSTESSQTDWEDARPTREPLRAAGFFVLFVAAVATYLMALTLVSIVVPPAGLVVLALPVVLWLRRGHRTLADILFGAAMTDHDRSRFRTATTLARAQGRKVLQRRTLEHDVRRATVDLQYLGGHPDLPRPMKVHVTRAIETTGPTPRDCVLLASGGHRALIPLDTIRSMRFGREFRRSAGGAVGGAIIAGALTGGLGTLVGAAVGGRRRADNTMSLRFASSHGEAEVLFEKCSAREYTSFVRLANLGLLAATEEP